MRIKWVSQTSIDLTNDLELMDLLVRTGCMGTVIGFESLDPGILKSMKKALNLMRKGGGRCQAQCNVLRDHHLQTWVAFTLGHDGDTVESVKETLDFAMDNKFCLAAFNILEPYPGTPLYDRLRSEGRLLLDGMWWLHSEYRFTHAAFIPSNMTPEEFTEACWYCRDHGNPASSIFKRMWNFKTHMRSLTRLATYLQYNPIYAKETSKKQRVFFRVFRKAIGTRSESPVPRPLAADRSNDAAVA